MPVRAGWLKAAWTGEFMAGVILPAVVVPTAFNSGVNLLYLLGSMLLAFMLLAVVVGFWNMTGIHGEVTGPLTFEEGQPIRVGTRAENRSRRTGYDLQVRIPLQGVAEAPVARYPRLEAGRQEAEPATCPTPMRGIYRFERFTVESPFPIGFMRTQRRVWLEGEPEELVVMPRMLAVDFQEAFGTDQTLEGEDILIHGVTGGSSYHGVRRYLFGDPLKNVHWKASARMGEIMVKEFQRPLQARYYLLLDMDEEQREGQGAESNLEYMVRLAASLGRHLEEARALYHFVWWDPELERARVSEAFGGRGDLDRARYLLAGLRSHRGSRAQSLVADVLPSLPPSSRLVFFVPRDVHTVPQEVAGVGYPTKAIFLVRTGTGEVAVRMIEGETGLAGGVDLYRYSIEHDRLDHEHG